MTSRITLAGDWWTAREEGRRLPEHELPAQQACDLCGRPALSDDWSDMAGMFICTACIEATLETCTDIFGDRR